MGDIYLGLVILAMLDMALFVAGRAVTRRLSPNHCNAIALITIVSLVLYTHYVWDHLALCHLLPFSNLIVLGNCSPLAAGLLGGIASRQVVIPHWRRWAAVTGLHSAALVAVLAPIAGRAPQCGNEWSLNGVCFQTTSKTCSPAAAATLLKRYGIDATEQEMAELCLTRNGTNWMGLYRGLKKKTLGTAWDVEAFCCSSQQLPHIAQPAIITIGWKSSARVDPMLQAEYGLKPGVRHSVVVLSYHDDGLVKIAEPTPNDERDGYERMTIDSLHALYRGQGLRLVPRRSR